MALSLRNVVGRITELRVPLAGHRLRVHLSRNGLPAATLPTHGWIEVGECMALTKEKLTLVDQLPL
jgi:hypothetical protein